MSEEPTKTKTRTRKFIKVVGTILLTLLSIYITSYLVLSVNGCYEPGSIGLNGVKEYSWAPYGFVTGYNWRSWPMIAYCPLYFADICLWHTEEKSESGRYPIDEVKPQDIWKLYEAYGLLTVQKSSAGEAKVNGGTRIKK